MYISIYQDVSGTRYDRFRALTFAPEADLTLSTLPVCQLQASIVTDDDIPVGTWVELYDDMDRLWVHYRVARSQRVEAHVLRIVARSGLALLDNWTMGAQFYRNATPSEIVSDIMNMLPKSGHMYRLDIAVNDGDFRVRGSGALRRVTGFAPAQTARERLQWLCLAFGGMVRQWQATGSAWDGAELAVVPTPDTAYAGVAPKLAPLSGTFWKPEVTWGDFVASLTVYAYGNFSTAERASYDGTVTDEDGARYYYDRSFVGFVNSDYDGEAGREMRIDGVMLIDPDTANAALGDLSKAYFRRRRLRADVIDNRQFFPGDLVRVYVEPERILEGIVQACDFTFGVQARARLTISVVGEVDTGKLRVSAMCGEERLGCREYVWPSGHAYSLRCPEIARYAGSGTIRQRFEPVTPVISGTLSPNMTGVTERTVEYRRVE